MVEILKLGLVKTLKFKFSGDADVWLRFLVDADLCLNLQYDFGKMNSTLGSVVPLAMFTLLPSLIHLSSISDYQEK